MVGSDQFWHPKLVRPDQITSTKHGPAGPIFSPDLFFRYRPLILGYVVGFIKIALREKVAGADPGFRKGGGHTYVTVSMVIVCEVHNLACKACQI